MSVPRSLNYSTGYTLKTVLRDYSTGAERVWNTATPGFEALSAGVLLDGSGQRPLF
jgi:hypothetical protein